MLINIESESEARLLDNIGKKINKKISVGFRLNPDVDAKTNKKISTGKSENKFGISIKNFYSLYKNSKQFKNLKIDALSVHIGSQILSDVPYKKTLKAKEGPKKSDKSEQTLDTSKPITLDFITNPDK